MANITIRGVDPETHARLKQEARQRGISVNSLVVELLDRRAGAWRQGYEPDRHHDLDRLAGTWTNEQCRAFQHARESCEEIEVRLWR